MCLEDRPLLEANAAGIDIGAREIFVAVPPDRDENPVRVFATFTEDLEEWPMAGELWRHHGGDGIHRGVLDSALRCAGATRGEALSGGRPGMKNVPGRRTDWHECQWLQFLHSVGLLRAAFRPDGEVCAVRSLMRHRSDLVECQPTHSAHAQSADPDECADPSRDQRPHRVTGLAIVDAILAGQATRWSWRNFAILVSKPVRRPFVNRWWATGAGASVYAEAVARDVSTLSGANRGLR